MTRYPKLRDGLVIRKVVEGDDVAFTVCDAPRDKYYRIDAVTHLVATQLDGTRPLSEVSRLCQEAMPHTDLSVPAVEEAVQDLDEIGLLEDPYQKNLLLLERAKAGRPRLSDFLQNMLLWKIGVWNPDSFLDRTQFLVAWLFRPLPAIITTIAFALCAVLVFSQRDRLNFDMRHLVFSGGGVGLFWFWVVYIVTGVFHELGHAYATKVFGGQVPRVGFMLMYFIPCMYAEVSQSMAFPNRWHRIWVAMGGIYSEVIFTVLATAVWWITPPETLLNEVAYRIMIVGFIGGVLMNLNPLIKLDGYYVLSDMLQIGELREGSVEYWKSRLLGLGRRRPEKEPVRGIRRRRAYMIYGAVTIVYTALILVAFVHWLHTWLVSSWAETGFILSIAAVVALLHKPLGGLLMRARSVRHLRRRPALLWGGAAIAFLLAATLIPTPAHVSAPASLIGSSREAVCVRQPGTVLAILVREGDRVAPRQVVALIGNDSLVAEVGRARASSEAEDLRLAQALRTRDPSAYRSSGYRATSAAAGDMKARDAYGGLALAVRDGGRVVTPRLEEWLGAFACAGDTLMIVEREDSVGVQIEMAETDVGLIEPGQSFELRFRAKPGRLLRGRILRVLPGAVPSGSSGRRFLVLGSLPGPPPGIPFGSSGLVRLQVGRWTLSERVARIWARFVRADLWL